MRRLVAGLLVSLWVPCAALAANWENVSLVDEMCASKDKVKADPDQHPTSCLLKCADSGYGVMTQAGWVKLDDAGNKMALAALKKTKKKDHVRVNVTGEQKGDVIQVSALKIAD
jgi:hypothetical protein